MKFIKMGEPRPVAKVKHNRIMVGYNLMGIFETTEGLMVEEVLQFAPKSQMFKQTSKYVPHQGKQEMARRVSRGT